MSKSPFLEEKIEFSRESTVFESAQATLIENFKEWLTGAISNDSIKQLPPKLFFPTAFVIQFIVLTYVIQSFINGYLSNINALFLSPSTSTSKYCNPIELSNTGQYLATQSGQWQSSSGFSYSLAAYQLTISNFQISTSEFPSTMSSIGYSFAVVGNLTLNQDLSINLLYWTSYVIVAPGANVGEYIASQRFNLVGNGHGICNVSAESSFDTSSGILSVSYTYDEFVSNPVCNASIVPSYFGYNADLFQKMFTISIDSRSVFTNVAINNGVAQLIYMTEITQKRGNYTIPGNGNNIYSFSSFYDPKFPGMAPLFCIYDVYINNVRVVPSPTFCLLPVGATFVMPIFNHMGVDQNLPVPCNCSEIEERRMSGEYFDDNDYLYYGCNQFYFITGFVYASLDFWMTNFQRFNSYNRFSQTAFNASFMTSSQGMMSTYKNEFIQGEMRRKAFDFCSSDEYGNCSMVTFSSYDLSAAGNWAVSDYYYQLQYGACTDSVSAPPAAWEELGNTPFAALVQDYVVCRNNPTTVFQNQLGSASGSIALIAPLAAITMLLLLRVYQKITGVTIPKSYARSEKDAAIEALSV
eukprot:gene14090-18909_t